MTLEDTHEPFQIGRVASNTFGIISRNLLTLIGLSVLIFLPNLLFSLYNGTSNAVLAGQKNGWMFAVAAFVVQMACTYLLQAAVVRCAITDLNGERPSFGQSLSTGLTLAVPVVIISVLYLLGVSAGMVLLIIPGMILAVAWSVAVPVRVVENTGISESFGRSRALTKGYRWPIFWIVVMYGILAFLLSAIVLAVIGVGLSGSATAFRNIPLIVVTWLEQVLLAIITAVGVAAIYYELRTIKEGIAPEQLASAFD
jgi:hypothetical protein